MYKTAREGGMSPAVEADDQQQGINQDDPIKSWEDWGGMNGGDRK